MRVVLVVPGRTVGVEAGGDYRQLCERVWEETGIAEFRLWAGSRCVQSDLDMARISDFGRIHMSLPLPGGVYSPEDLVLSGESLHHLVCRRCYSRNNFSRKTCHKCGHPDLRSGKKRLRDVVRIDNPARQRNKK